MKKGEQAELSAKWWKDSQPKGLKAAPRLDDALKAYEIARKSLEGGGDGKAAGLALDGVEAAAKLVIAEAVKAKGAAELEWTVDALKKLDRPIAADRKWIATQASDDGDDEGDFANPDQFKKYLNGLLRRVRAAGEMNFAAVLGRGPHDHRLSLHKVKAPHGLGTALMQQTGLHAMTFGVAMTPKAAGLAEEEELEAENPERDIEVDQEKPRTLVLSLLGRQLPGLQNKLTKMLRAFGPLAFNTVVLMIDGKVVEDLADPDDATTGPSTSEPHNEPTAGQLRAMMEKLSPALKAAMLKHPEHRAAMMAAAGDFVKALNSNDVTAANTALKRAMALLAEVRDHDAVPSGPGKVEYAKLRLDWDAARHRAGEGLKQLEQAVLEEFQGADDYDEMTVRVRKLDLILETLAGELQDKLDEALNAEDHDKPPIHQEALAIISRYRAYVDSDPLVLAIDDNPYLPLTVQHGLSSTLAQLATALA